MFVSLWQLSAVSYMYVCTMETYTCWNDRTVLVIQQLFNDLLKLAMAIKLLIHTWNNSSCNNPSITTIMASNDPQHYRYCHCPICTPIINIPSNKQVIVYKKGPETVTKYGRQIGRNAAFLILQLSKPISFYT